MHYRGYLSPNISVNETVYNHIDDDYYKMNIYGMLTRIAFCKNMNIVVCFNVW